MALMAERGSVKELGSCSAQTISKALVTAMRVYRERDLGRNAISRTMQGRDLGRHFPVF